MRQFSLLSACLMCIAACSQQPVGQPPGGAGQALLFEGARLITGDGRPPIEPSAFIVENGRITAVAEKGGLQAPQGATRVDVTGKTVMPALVDAHSHLGYTDVKRMITSAANYTRENLTDHLRRYAYYGIAATLSMGVDRGEVPYQLRAEPPPGAALFRTAGRGIALPNAGPGAEYRRDAAYGVTTEAEARTAVRELAASKVDFVKIWVDDRDGTVKKLPPPCIGRSSMKRTRTGCASSRTSSTWPMPRSSCARESTASRTASGMSMWTTSSSASSKPGQTSS